MVGGDCGLLLGEGTMLLFLFSFSFFFNDTATTEIYTLSLHDALPISSQNKERVKRALSNMNESYSDQRLFLTMQEGELDIPLKEITFIQGERNYSNIHLESGRKILVAKTLVDLEELLTEKGFFRCHKSYIVGSSHIASAGRERIHMKSGQSLTLSRRKKEGFLEWWKTKN